MISVVVLMVISSLYFNVITSVIIMQQTLSSVCRRTNNYFVALLCTSLSSFLLQVVDWSCWTECRLFPTPQVFEPSRLRLAFQLAIF